jgi:septum formation protein
MAEQRDKILLASSSPRRRELLDQIGVAYEALEVFIDETPHSHETPTEYVVRVAAEKSRRGQESRDGSFPVLGADTEVILDGEVFGKPKDLEHAMAMLTKLSGRRHEVLSAVSLRLGSAHWQAVNTSLVSFRTLEIAEIIDYWTTGEPQDKAGAYAIQGRGAVFVRHLSGSFSGVMGLPLYETAELLRSAGVRF